MKLIKLIFFFYPFIAKAQMAAPSIFSEMKSVNPAVINHRPIGQFTAAFNNDNFKKQQDLDTQDSTLKASANGFSVFRGAKGAGFLSTETSIIIQTGKRNVEIRNGDPLIDFDSKIDYKQIKLGAGIGQIFGAEIIFEDFKVDQSFEFKQEGSETLTSDESIKRNSLGAKLGFALPLGPVRFGAYYQMDSAHQIVKSTRPALPESDTKPKNKFVGISLGIKTTSFHTEFGYEKFLNPEKGLQEPPEDPAPSARNKLSATIEFKIGSLALGYTGRLYQDGYKNPDQTVVNQLIYENNLEDRLEHNFNFSLGSDKGMSFGASATYSKLKGDERSPLNPAAIKTLYPTTSTEFGLMAKVGYTW